MLGIGVFRAALAAGRAPINPFVVSMAVTGPMFVVGALCHGDVRELIWGLAALLDLSTPTVLRTPAARTCTSTRGTSPSGSACSC